MNVEALVLAAGLGTRLSELAPGLPKPLVPIAGRPLVEWSLRWLAAAGVAKAWVNLHHRADAIRSALGDGEAAGIFLRYSEEDPILGTAGAWRKLAPWPRTSLVVYGDNLMRFDLRRFAEAHHRGGAVATIALFDPAVNACTGIAGGRALVRDGVVTAFVEGGDQGLVNAGAYLLEPAVLEVVPEGFSDFGRDVLPVLARQKRLAAYVMEPEGFCLGVDTPERFRIAESMLESGEVDLT